MSGTLVYLASPYSDPSPEVRAQRFDAAVEASAWLLRQGYMVFSPITHTHPIALSHDLDGTWDAWAEFDRRMVLACDELAVLCIDGWQESRGIAAEMEIAHAAGKPLSHLFRHEDNWIRWTFR